MVEARGLRKAYGDRLLIDDLNFKLPPGGIVGVIGPNGAGKTTLFRMITGVEKPDAGELRVGEAVKMAYVDQSRDALNGDKSVFEEVSGGLDYIDLGRAGQMPSRAYLAGFAFKGQDQQKRVKDLSGGERNRVHLAKMLKSGGNLLLLDEPTNDLDVETLRSPGGCAAELRGLRGGHQPRPLVPGPHRHAHPGVRGRQPGVLLRGQLPGLRGGQEEAPGARGAGAAPHPLPSAHQELRPGVPLLAPSQIVMY